MGTARVRFPVGLGAALVAALTVGCTKEGDKPPASAGQGPPAKPAVEAKVEPAKKPAKPAAGGSAYDRVIASFDGLERVAGRGEIETEGLSNWKPAFEGKPALEAELSRPYFAVADGKGRVFIADKEAHGVRVVGADGTIRTLAGGKGPSDDGDGPAPAATMGLNAPNGLRLGPDGTLYVLDRDNGKIRKITWDGDKATMATLFTVPGGIETGRGLWVADDASRVFFASKHTLKSWTPKDGVQVRAKDFVSLGNLEVTPKGELIAADRGGNQVYRVEEDGTRTPIAGNGKNSGGGHGKPALETGLHGPRGVAHDPRTGGLFITTQEGSELWLLDPDGKTIHLLWNADPNREVPFETGSFALKKPRGVSLAPNGDLILTADNAGYVYRLVRRGA